MVRVNLEQDCRVVLLPVSTDVKDFETGVVRGVERLLCVCADDLRDWVAESW